MTSMSAAELSKEVRDELKKAFPECVFSVRKESFSGGREIKVSLMQAPFQVFADLLCGKDNEYTHTGKYAQLNHLYLNETCNGYHLTPEAVELLRKVTEIANKRNWDHSDSQSDYFDVNFYFHLEIGQWDKPFQVVSK